ncbi:MAG TPA: RNA degradosome polyphosphate kinase [Acidimicrobiales bacterium]|nr:RNA degradosome polyphosphate kinase [Acidimicrobiales bacterium]
MPSADLPRASSQVDAATTPAGAGAGGASTTTFVLEGAPTPGPGDSFTEVVEELGHARFSNRELSWLEFGARLLDLGEDPEVPLLERVKFLAIFSEGLDEFFQVRVAGLKDQVDAGLRARSPDGLRPSDALKEIAERVRELVERQSRIFVDQVGPALAEAGIRFSDWSSLDDDDRGYLVDVFERQIFPVLTPLSVDPGHPFPYISNLSLNLIVRVGDPVSGEERVARVKVPPLLPRFVVMPDGERFVPLEQVIAAHLGLLFGNMVIGEHYAFRVTRNADLALEEDEADDLLAAVEMELRRRRFGRAVRLEISSETSTDMRDMLLRELDLEPDDLYETEAPLDLGGLWSVHALDRPDLHEGAWAPMTPPGLASASNEPTDLFAVLRERDVLVHHPYDSFTTSVEAFVAQAAADPDVLAIKQTLYRTSGDSPIVASLIQAAEAGKQVAAVVELKARFDEQANILWARALEEAGVHVVYGLVGLKTHSKALLVVRREEEGIRLYCHLGTGNYNPRTARLYEDMGLLSADRDLGADVGDLFNFLTGYSRSVRYRKLVVSPLALRSRIIELIEQEARLGAEGRITVKVNGLTDPDVIDALYRASRAGVPIDLIVRGVCCLRPGISGLSETIRVRSIVGRFLEHSRIYRFGGTVRPLTLLMGSADLMERNLDRRIELLFPVTDGELQARLLEVLDLDLADDTNAWVLGTEGSWSRVPTTVGVSVQRRLQEMARDRARRRREPEALGAKS